MHFPVELTSRIKALSKVEGKPKEQIRTFNELHQFLSLLPDSENLSNKFEAFCQSQCKIDKIWLFWREFITKSMLPYLGLYLSMRSGQWDLRLASLKMMAPVFHAFDCSNYINIIPNHIAEINCMSLSVLGHFEKGALVASLKGNAWSSVALDGSHEMCINKDVKGAISKLSDDYISRTTPYLSSGLDRWKIFFHRYFLKKIQPNS